DSRLGEVDERGPMILLDGRRRPRGIEPVPGMIPVRVEARSRRLLRQALDHERAVPTWRVLVERLRPRAEKRLKPGARPVLTVRLGLCGARRWQVAERVLDGRRVSVRLLAPGELRATRRRELETGVGA